MLSSYHVRECASNTIVTQAGGVITYVTKHLGDRLKEAREAAGLSQGQLADAAGVSQSTIGNIEAGIRKQPRELLSIAAVVKVRPEWLKTGKGPRELPSANVEDAERRKRVPLISWVKAGHFGDVEDHYEPGDAPEWVDVYDTNPGDPSFALRVVGESMTSPIPGALSFPEGTIIVVDPTQGGAAGDFVVAKDIATQKATFKKLVTDSGRWYLRPLNPAFPTVEIDDPSVRVIGRVIEYQTRGKL